MRAIVRRLLSGCFWMLVALPPVAAPLAWAAHGPQNAVPRGERHEYKHDIEDLEDRWRVAVSKADASALAVLLADDYVGISSNGMLQTKEETLSSVRTGQYRIDKMNVIERKVRLYGKTAVVNSHVEVKGVVSGQPVGGMYRYTRVYFRDAGGQWKIVSFEVNHVDDGHR